MNYEITQAVFPAIERLAALCATPGIDKEVIKKANENISALLDILKLSFQKLSATTNGLIV